MNPPIIKNLSIRKFEWQKGKDEIGLYVYALTTKNYEILSHDFAEIRRGVNEMNAKLVYYMDCIETFNASISSEPKPVEEKKTWWELW